MSDQLFDQTTVLTLATENASEQGLNLIQIVYLMASVASTIGWCLLIGWIMVWLGRRFCFW